MKVIFGIALGLIFFGCERTMQPQVSSDLAVGELAGVWSMSHSPELTEVSGVQQQSGCCLEIDTDLRKAIVYGLKGERVEVSITIKSANRIQFLAKTGQSFYARTWKSAGLKKGDQWLNMAFERPERDPDVADGVKSGTKSLSECLRVNREAAAVDAAETEHPSGPP